MNRIFENNNVVVSGEIVSEFTYNHEVYGEKFYTEQLSVERLSGQADILQIMVSDRLVDTGEDMTGKFVKIYGQIRTYNKNDGEKNRLILSVFAREFEEIEEMSFFDFENTVVLDGYICKIPNYHKTPLGREIADFVLAVNRPYGKSDYIPCIAWGRNANFVSGLDVGTRIRLSGRLQSREYQKKISDTEFETRVAYEVSARKVEAVEEAED